MGFEWGLLFFVLMLLGYAILGLLAIYDIFKEKR